jgi:hypothetical protein
VPRVWMNRGDCCVPLAACQPVLGVVRVVLADMGHGPVPDHAWTFDSASLGNLTHTPLEIVLPDICWKPRIDLLVPLDKRRPHLCGPVRHLGAEIVSFTDVLRQIV